MSDIQDLQDRLAAAENRLAALEELTSNLAQAATVRFAEHTKQLADVRAAHEMLVAHAQRLPGAGNTPNTDTKRY